MRLPFCVACLSTVNLHQHHLKPKLKGGTDDETNLITLCSTCHGILHCVEIGPSHSELTRLGMRKADHLKRSVDEYVPLDTVPIFDRVCILLSVVDGIPYPALVNLRLKDVIGGIVDIGYTKVTLSEVTKAEIIKLPTDDTELLLAQGKYRLAKSQMNANSFSARLRKYRKQGPS